AAPSRTIQIDKFVAHGVRICGVSEADRELHPGSRITLSGGRLHGLASLELSSFTGEKPSFEVECSVRTSAESSKTDCRCEVLAISPDDKNPIALGDCPTVGPNLSTHISKFNQIKQSILKGEVQEWLKGRAQGGENEEAQGDKNMPSGS